MVLLGLVLGLVFASFVNVAAGGKKSPAANIFRKHSVCDKCGKTLVWWELIPVVSWLLLRGRCSKCKKPISIFHPISELILGLSVAGIFWVYSGDLLNLIFYSTLIIILYFFAVFDFDKRLVPNIYLFPLIALLVIYRIVLWAVLKQSPEDFVLGGIIYPAIFTLFIGAGYYGLLPGVKRGVLGFGWGDVKLAIFIGLGIGLKLVIVSFFGAVFSGALVGVILLLIKRKRGLKMPFVPFMFLGTVIAIVFGREIISWLLSFYLY